MSPQELLNRLESILDEAKTGVLATKDSSGVIHMRWMTPAVLNHRQGAIFTFSAPGTPKIEQIMSTEQAEWMIQRPDLREIVNIQGPIRVIDNPALKSELMEILGPRLTAFWKANIGSDQFVVLETVIQTATYFKPMEGLREAMEFSWE